MNGHGPPDTDREFWLEIRRGFLLIVGAIDKRFSVGRFEPREKSLAKPNEHE